MLFWRVEKLPVKLSALVSEVSDLLIGLFQADSIDGCRHSRPFKTHADDAPVQLHFRARQGGLFAHLLILPLSNGRKASRIATW